MATTVTSSFKEFSSNLNISDRQESLVSTCRNNVVSKIGNSLQLHSSQPSKLIGSYDRDTITRCLIEGDVDVMVVLHYGKNKDWDNEEGVSKALNKFKEILKESYPKTECNIDRNCITMKLSEFRLDVVPAFRFNDGTYTIPDTYRKKWLSTDPVSFSSEVTRINKNMDGTFIPLIKMVKGWNRTFNKKLRGFHIECMMIHHYKNYKESYSYQSTLRVFFSKLPSYLGRAMYDPITGDRADLYLDNESLGYNREHFIKRATKASESAEEAFQDSDKYPSIAIGEWKALFGEFFPTYG